MPNLTLASGRLTASGDTLTIELSMPNETPAVILFKWPPAPSVVTPKEMGRVITAAMQVLAQARIRLSQIRAQGCADTLTDNAPPAQGALSWVAPQPGVTTLIARAGTRG